MTPPSASLPVLAAGAGMAAALMLGLPLWVGFVAGFVPTFAAGAVIHVRRAE